ncbi:hypothetical protein FB45DRAFT_873742 [Roridomyces roridus]|uniref:Uncharacterized protein n=1 Tax=Roridomyces roridus TaxID=1738132 RepID=A0AAD7FF31_9AGAR|nr:hypothetical protein FB45DRAFT_873742 [Roridomyces roridus]
MSSIQSGFIGQPQSTSAPLDVALGAGGQQGHFGGVEGTSYRISFGTSDGVQWLSLDGISHQSTDLVSLRIEKNKWVVLLLGSGIFRARLDGEKEESSSLKLKMRNRMYCTAVFRRSFEMAGGMQDLEEDSLVLKGGAQAGRCKRNNQRLARDRNAERNTGKQPLNRFAEQVKKLRRRMRQNTVAHNGGDSLTIVDKWQVAVMMIFGFCANLHRAQGFKHRGRERRWYCAGNTKERVVESRGSWTRRWRWKQSDGDPYHDFHSPFSHVHRATHDHGTWHPPPQMLGSNTWTFGPNAVPNLVRIPVQISAQPGICQDFGSDLEKSKKSEKKNGQKSPKILLYTVVFKQLRDINIGLSLPLHRVQARYGLRQLHLLVQELIQYESMSISDSSIIGGKGNSINSEMGSVVGGGGGSRYAANDAGMARSSASAAWTVVGSFSCSNDEDFALRNPLVWLPSSEQTDSFVVENFDAVHDYEREGLGMHTVPVTNRLTAVRTRVHTRTPPALDGRNIRDGYGTATLPSVPSICEIDGPSTGWRPCGSDQMEFGRALDGPVIGRLV